MKRAYIVPPGCSLEFAGAGRIPVCGLTTNELSDKIREPLERDYFKKATVSVEIEDAIRQGQPGGVVYLIGSIARPGPLLLPRDQVFTLTKAIIAAGGFTQFSKSSAVRVLRYCDDGKKYDTYVNVARIMAKGEFERDIPLQPNDWVIVGQKFISF
jgi:protein involved in polysaccharide export with SLBB domain